MIAEDHAVGTAAIQQLVAEGVPVTPIIRTKDKVTRVEDILPMIATRCVKLPRKAPWLSDFLAECAGFRKDGNHKHDDMIDPMADACKLMLGAPPSTFDVMRPVGDKLVPSWMGR